LTSVTVPHSRLLRIISRVSSFDDPMRLALFPANELPIANRY
jgi:hypothetical protein